MSYVYYPKSKKRENTITFLILYYIVPIILIIGIAWGVSTYIDLVSSEDKAILIGAFLTGSSILFGFTSSSLIRFSNKIMDFKQRTSDVAEEFCQEYKKVEANKELSLKHLSYKTKISKWGRSSAFGANGDALYTIKQAYDFLVSILRWWLDLYSTIIYLLQGTALFILGLSVLFGLLSYAPSLTDITLSLSIASFMSAIPILVFGWIISHRLLNQLDDTLFNVRQQIHGGIIGILPHEYQTEYRKFM